VDSAVEGIQILEYTVPAGRFLCALMESYDGIGCTVRSMENPLCDERVGR
jgi:hypothetical protein